MTLQKQFEQELFALKTTSGTTMNVGVAPRRIRCEIIESNPLATSFSALCLSTTELDGASVQQLQRISQSLASRLTYLMEPISPIEVDAEACVVQLRSTPPQKDDDGHCYYELIVRRGGEIALGRYRKEAGKSREAIMATVTREVLVRLVKDFCAVLD